jgi:hypothetical protein
MKKIMKQLKEIIYLKKIEEILESYDPVIRNPVKRLCVKTLWRICEFINQ